MRSLLLIALVGVGCSKPLDNRTIVAKIHECVVHGKKPRLVQGYDSTIQDVKCETTSHQVFERFVEVK